MQVSGLPAGFEPSQNLQRGREAGVRWDGAVTVVWSAGKSRGSAAITRHCEARRARKDLMEQHFSVSHQQTNKQTKFRVICYNWYVLLYMEYPQALTSQGCLGSKTLLKSESLRVEICCSNCCWILKIHWQREALQCFFSSISHIPPCWEAKKASLLWHCSYISLIIVNTQVFVMKCVVVFFFLNQGTVCFMLPFKVYEAKVCTGSSFTPQLQWIIIYSLIAILKAKCVRFNGFISITSNKTFLYFLLFTHWAFRIL